MQIRPCAMGAFALGMAGLLAGGPVSAQEKVKAVPGPIDNVQDLQDTAKVFFKLADTNNDGQISQKEAIDAGNLLVGGFFFRADVNGDGTLTTEEARNARDALFSQQPLLQFVLERARPTNQPEPGGAVNAPGTAQTANGPAQVVKKLADNPARTIGEWLDTNRDRNLQSSEVRQGVQTGVQTIFAIADHNADGQLSPAELNAAVGETARSVVQNAFQAADTDQNGMLSVTEFDTGLKEPAHAVFRILDANGDNQLTLQELDRAEQVLMDQLQRLRVPEPENSISNQLRRAQTAPPTTLRSPGQLYQQVPTQNPTAQPGRLPPGQ
jgi:Ca2+-binding EF-hand superfamily protein